jgi:cytochrome oxidase Cu insertion factor (SCO1/SenC/PrrC family)
MERARRYPGRAVWLNALLHSFLMLLLLGLGSPAGLAGAIGKGPDNPRMANAASPYLQTHKNDLVQWHPWGDAAFALARERGVPVMVSFGYTACHWCHVMQETHFNATCWSPKS